MKNDKIELLAPAGNFDCLVAAVRSGADAVYFAGQMFGARSYADNFSNDEIKQAVAYCHILGVRVYVTVNTLISDREIPDAMEYLKFLNRIGVDAVIVQDLGLCSLIRENFPNLPIHGSTQMTVHNAEGVLALEKMGISQVVLSRELSLEEIRKIKEKTTAKLEIFAHGALCMSYSGQCLFSSVLGGRSGNRGKCAQPCRLKYRINNGNNERFYLSLKDLCAIEHIKELSEIGAASLKIEGRMKGSEYVSEVVGIYRKYIDSGESPKIEDLERLNRIFFRGGMTDGYLTGKQGREMFCFDKPDNPYEKQIKTEKNETDFEKKRKLSAKLRLFEGDYPQIEVTDGNISAICQGISPLAASEKRPITEEFIKEKVNKTGGTPFEFEKIEAKIKGNPFISVGEINELRRTALAKFEEKLVTSFYREGAYSIPEIKEKEMGEGEFVCRVANIEQFRVVKNYDFAKITVPDYIILENVEEFASIKDRIIIETAGILKEMPDSLKQLYELGFRNLSSDNIAFLELDGFKMFGGWRMNVFNSHTLKFLKEQGLKSIAVSPELNLAQIRDMDKSIKIQTMVYGYQPLMLTENCVIRNGESCPCNKDINYLTDRKGIKFPVLRDGKSHRSVILNSTPTYMGDRIDEIKRSGVELFMVYFTIEGAEETKKICDAVLCGGKIESYTRLHYGKGVL